VLMAACGGSTSPGQDASSDDASETASSTTATTPMTSGPTMGATTAEATDTNPAEATDTNPGNDTTTGSADDTSTGGDTEPCNDRCPAPNGGIEWMCERRFAHGTNYAWHHFAGDFGGVPQWGQGGVSTQPEVIGAELQAMRDAGATVIRWWVLPDFRGAGVAFDGTDTPTGLGGTMVADLETALDLAEAADVYLMPCLFSFDGFRPTHDLEGLPVRGLQPLVTNEARREALLETVVRPIAQAVAAHPHAQRVIAWDVINEPEWAMSGSSPYGDMDYTPNPDLQTVTHAQMETFVADTIAVLRAESDAMVTVGGAAMKWAHAWSVVDIDFYQFHIYDWVDDYWPYDMSPSDYGVDDKPVVMGEFPIGGLSSASYTQLLNAWWDLGYAGAMGWQHIEATPGQLQAMRDFADAHACEAAW